MRPRVQKVQMVLPASSGRVQRVVVAAPRHACGVRVQKVLRVLRFDSPSG